MINFSSMVAQALSQRANHIENGIDRREARRNAYEFIKYVGTDNLGKPLKIDDFTKLFVSIFEDCYLSGYHFSFSAPPGTGKSTLARLLMLYHIGRNPNLRTVITSADKSKATESVVLCRNIVTSLPFGEVFPEIIPDNERSKTNVSKSWKQGSWYVKTSGQQPEPTMSAWASIPSAESSRIDILLADDIVTESTYTGEKHEKVCNSFFNTFIEGRLSNGGWCCYLQNVRGENDLLHRLTASKKFCSVWVVVSPDLEKFYIKVWNPPRNLDIIKNPQDYNLTQVETDGTNRLISYQFEMPFPESPLWTKEELMKKNEKSLRQLYMGIGVSVSDLLLPSFRNRERNNYKVSELVGGVYMDGKLSFPEDVKYKFAMSASLDLSGQNRKGMAFNILAKDRTGKKYLLETWTIKADIEEVLIRINDAWTRGLKFDIFLVESNAVQSTIISAMLKLAEKLNFEWGSKIVPFVTGENKHDLNIGLPSIDVQFKNGSFIWAGGMSVMANDRDCSPQEREIGLHWYELEQVLETATLGITQQKTPDNLMSFWFADRGLERIMPDTQGATVKTLINADRYVSQDIVLS